jgi:hypothetical protein
VGDSVLFAGIMAFCCARSLSAAWAEAIALEVPALEVSGDPGLSGSGGGQRSGSELSHLFPVRRRKKRMRIYTEANVNNIHWNKSSKIRV